MAGTPLWPSFAGMPAPRSVGPVFYGLEDPLLPPPPLWLDDTPGHKGRALRSPVTPYPPLPYTPHPLSLDANIRDTGLEALVLYPTSKGPTDSLHLRTGLVRPWT